MTIQVGDKLPSATLIKATDNGPDAVQTDEFFAGRKVALFSVPGAFTPTCSARHLPGFVENIDALKAKGVDEVACTAVNDAFVMAAWAKQAGAEGKVTMLSDGKGAGPGDGRIEIRHGHARSALFDDCRGRCGEGVECRATGRFPGQLGGTPSFAARLTRNGPPC
jgi:hypothetical protein